MLGADSADLRIGVIAKPGCQKFAGSVTAQTGDPRDITHASTIGIGSYIDGEDASSRAFPSENGPAAITNAKRRAALCYNDVAAFGGE